MAIRSRFSRLRNSVLFVLTALASSGLGYAQAAVSAADPSIPAIRRAIVDLQATYGSQYPMASDYLAQLATLEGKLATATDDTRPQLLADLNNLRREALLANPILDFDKILVVKRGYGNLALPANWQGNSSLWGDVDNEIALFSLKSPDAPLQTLYKPAKRNFVGDVDLNFDADKMLFSSRDENYHWQVFQINADGQGLRQLTSSPQKDIDSYDPTYLPDGRIIFDCSSGFHGVPCVGGSDYVGNLHLMNADGSGVRRLCFDQDNDWCPTVLPSGRVLYLRWEYTDSAHYFSRVLMSMNPDGTNQTEFYGSNSYWPNSLFYARPIPGSSTKFVGIVTGHHGVTRMGELVLFDAAKGRKEDTGALQRIPGWGKPVIGEVKDQLVNDSWPKFLHPYPLNDKYFLVAAQPTANSGWGLYLVDIFDNMVLLKQEKDAAIFEPIPFRKTPRPPVIPDKVKLDQKTATVYLHDIYAGPGLRDVPRGTVKNLRVFQYEFAYRNMGGHYEIGMEGPWDVRRIVGTVPVNPDGSAMFTIPANHPVALQPLDAEGKALQQMRSWFVGMPGEYVSCVGCHEKQNSTTAPKLSQAARMLPSEPLPWYGPKRGFSFVRDVQPVLDRKCSGCHSGQPGRPNLSDPTIAWTSWGISRQPRSYTALHPYVRRNGPEGDYSLLTPLEFHANTSPLIQMLEKGHYNVKLNKEEQDRLITWIDLNVPAHGTWHEVNGIPNNFQARRHEMDKLYAGVDEDIEAIPPQPATRPAFEAPVPEPARPAPMSLSGWPFDEAAARKMQADLGKTDLQFDLGNGVRITLKRIPAGEFVMGDVWGAANEFPQARVKIAKPFWIATTETSLQAFQQFLPEHRNGYYDMHYKDQVKPGYLMDSPEFPAIRVSYAQAMQFCKWLSAKTGKKVTLPTEAQWEWAARAGTASSFFYGDTDTDFGPYANLADVSIKKLAVTGVDPQPINNPDQYWDFVPKDARFDDGFLHLAPVGHYKTNAWGLYDMIGNVAEWTRSDYQPYPYTGSTDTSATTTRKVVRGGSWADRPKDATSSTRWGFPQWQHVYNVGFRVIVEE